jgi:hypothetical protein
MEKNRNYEHTGRVVALAIAFFGGFALLGHAAGVFERLGTELTLTLAAFAVVFGALTYHLDPGVRSFVKRLVAPRAAASKPGRAAPV